MRPIEESILALLAAARDGGLSAAELGRALAEHAGLRPADRTLKRRLSEMVEAGHLRREGRGPATRYFPLATAKPGPASPGTPDNADQRIEPIPLSTDARDLVEQVRQPTAARRLVGYNERFLHDYQPGRDWYLDRATRERLRRIGESVAGGTPAGTFARQIYERLLIDLAWSSSRLEGNTYSRLDTERLLREGRRAEGKDSREAQMILNHKKAIELLVEGAESAGFNRYTLTNLHAALSENLLGNPADEGRLRTVEVGITGTTYIPLSIPQKLEELFDTFLAKAEAIDDPFEQAFFAMVHLPYLQPFIDVNKRVSRLAANIPFIRENLCPLSFVEVPERTYVEGTLAVYELNRTELLRDLFVWAYERSATRFRVVHQALPEPDPIRLRYRAELGEIVRDVVIGTRQLPLSSSTDVAKQFGIAPEDTQAFELLAESVVAGLHEGNFARYGVRPSEFRRWAERRGGIG